MKISEARTLTVNTVVANKLNHFKIVGINKEDDKVVSFELEPMYAQLNCNPQTKTIKIDSMKRYDIIELPQEEQEPVQTTLNTIKVVRLTDSKNGTFKKGEIYEAVEWGNHNYKIKIDDTWKPSPKTKWTEFEPGQRMKKIDDGLYTYKGLEITRNDTGYHCSIMTKTHSLPIRVDAPTQNGMKNCIDNVIRQYGIIKDG